MDKFKQFFSRINLLNEQQFDELSKYATFDIAVATRKPGAPLKTTLNITLNSVPPVELFGTFLKNIQKINDKLKVNFIGPLVPVDVEQLTDYIQYFFQVNNIHNVLLLNLIKRENIAISDTGLVIVTYDNKSEMKEFKLIEKSLHDFFRSINFFVSGFDYEINPDHQKIETYRIAKEEQILATLKPINSSEIEFKRVEAHNRNAFTNKYKDPLTKISDIVYTGDNQYINVSGEIFKIKQDTLKNGTQKFVFYISDYEESIPITLFAGFKKAFNSYMLDINLPVFYLNSFKKGDWVKARIRVDQNKYTNNEIQGLCNCITKTDKPKQFLRDDIEDKKRVELLAHTNMSMFDGLIEPEKLIRRSKVYN
jgi:DNA polymerase-3 subunit alpha (Gram-positive type)